MGKLGTWLLVLIAVVFLARPQGTDAVNNTETIASVEYLDEGSDSGSIILTVVLITIIIGVIADACGQEDL